MDSIFQPFRGAFTRGTGLGLSIVHRIASDYGGEVRVKSNPGQGTTVEVALPLARAAATSDVRPASELSSPAGAIQTQNSEIQH
jgi:signal transduction histidine kinase